MFAPHKEQPESVSEAARTRDRRGGRPRGSFSPLGAWLRDEAERMRRDGYRCCEAFEILRDAEEPDGLEAFWVSDDSGEQAGIAVAAR